MLTQTWRRISRVLTPLAPALTLLVLGGLAAQQWTAGPDSADGPPAAGPRLTGHLAPTIEPWVGQPWQPPDSIWPMLHGVERLGRVYENVQTGRRVAVLLVQGTEPRDLRGYAPPRWYTARGWHRRGHRKVDWRIADANVPAGLHNFSQPGVRGPQGAALGPAGSQLKVTSFVVWADGSLTRRVSGGAGAFASGTGRGRVSLVQVILPGDTPHKECETILDKLMRAAILSIQE